MLAVKVSPKYQVVIPKEVRESLHLIPGQKMQVVQYEDRVEFIPEKEVGELKGALQSVLVHRQGSADRCQRTAALPGSRCRVRVLTVLQVRQVGESNTILGGRLLASSRVKISL